MIEAIIDPSKLDAVKAALVKFGLRGMTISEVLGWRRDESQEQFFRGAPYVIDLRPQVKIEIVIDERTAPRVADVIAVHGASRRTPQVSILSVDLDEAIRIRTGDWGEAAI
jgi:nitrogen regulatory protein P-II 1